MSQNRVTPFPRVFTVLFTGIPNYVLFIALLGFLGGFSGLSLEVSALPTVQKFDEDPGLVLSDQDFYSLPLSFSSADKIHQYLVGHNSVLASLSFPVTMVADSAVLNQAAFADRPYQFQTPNQVGQYLGQTMRAADIIWLLSRSNMSSSCGMYYSGGAWYTNTVCYDGAANPINPGFLLSMIQKESGLVYGSNSQLPAGDGYLQFLLDRVVGYYCFETSDRTRSCYDENPNWIYYKGFFRQLFFAVRLLRLREQMCRIGGSFAFSNANGVFQVGSFVQISGRWIMLKNGISCSMYIYTPHTISQRLALQVMHELQIDRNLVEISGLPPEYIPTILITFSDEILESEVEVEEDELVIDPPDELYPTTPETVE